MWKHTTHKTIILMKVYSSSVDLRGSNYFAEYLTMPHDVLQEMTYRTKHEAHKTDKLFLIYSANVKHKFYPHSYVLNSKCGQSLAAERCILVIGNFKYFLHMHLHDWLNMAQLWSSTSSWCNQLILHLCQEAEVSLHKLQGPCTFPELKNG